MLDTLFRFGQHLSNESSRLEFDRIIATPPIDEKEKAKKPAFLVVEIIFDLDAGTFHLNDKPRTFDDSDKTARWSPYNLRCVKIQKGNNKNIYPTAANPSKSFGKWKKTFFGKEDEDGNLQKQAELAEAIEKDFPDLVDTPVYRAATEIFKMREAFEEAFPEWKKVIEALNWGDKSRVVMLFASVVSKELGCPEPVPVAKLEGFDNFLRQKFLQRTSKTKNSKGNSSALSKICYVTGEQKPSVATPAFYREVSLNKMFVTTTKNYASGFDQKAFAKNYQVSSEAQSFLELGSEYVLKNLTVKIAGVDHCILPQFRGGKVIDLEGQVPLLKGKTELLFSMSKKEFRKVVKDIRLIADGDLYWITFLGYDTNGNFFKTISLIKDISKTHFESVIKVLRDVGNEMSETQGVDWEKVMFNIKEQTQTDFNFYTVFNLIPVREEKDKRNAALALFKAILERRPIARDDLFDHFSELIQCHRFERYAAYNILPHNNFDFAIRDAVFQYLAFFQFLKKIKLLNMEEKTTSSAATLEEKNAGIATFFERMGYSDDQRALFYLGRVLSSVGRAQFDKGHKTKPVLQKVNYNGMDAAALKRLHADLFEKSKQYEIMKYTEGTFSRFTDLFKDSPDDRWDKRMKPEESLFYLLSGYSFRTPNEAVENTETLATELEN